MLSSHSPNCVVTLKWKLNFQPSSSAVEREGEKWKVCFRLFRGWKSFRNYVRVWKMSVIKIGKIVQTFFTFHENCMSILDYRITRETSNVFLRLKVESSAEISSSHHLSSRPEIHSLFFFASRLPSDATGINRIWVCDLLSIAIVFILRISLRTLVTFIHLIVIHPFPDTRVNIYVFCSFPFLFHVHVFSLAGYLNFRYFTRT